MKIVIVGAGIIGLSTGLCLKKWNKNIEVTIVSDKLTPETTADGAAGIWSIFLLGDTPIDKQKYNLIYISQSINLLSSFFCKNYVKSTSLS